MKSRRSPLSDHADLIKKPTSNTSQTSLLSSKSSSNTFIKRNLAALQHTYNTLFGQKTPFYIGDAETHFKKTLRQYGNFDYVKNSSWIKTDTEISTRSKRDNDNSSREVVSETNISSTYQSPIKSDNTQSYSDSEFETPRQEYPSEQRQHKSRTPKHKQLKKTVRFQIDSDLRSIGNKKTKSLCRNRTKTPRPSNKTREYYSISDSESNTSFESQSSNSSFSNLCKNTSTHSESTQNKDSTKSASPILENDLTKLSLSQSISQSSLISNKNESEKLSSSQSISRSSLVFNKEESAKSQSNSQVLLTSNKKDCTNSTSPVLSPTNESNFETYLIENISVNDDNLDSIELELEKKKISENFEKILKNNTNNINSTEYQKNTKNISDSIPSISFDKPLNTFHSFQYTTNELTMPAKIEKDTSEPEIELENVDDIIKEYCKEYEDQISISSECDSTDFIEDNSKGRGPRDAIDIINDVENPPPPLVMTNEVCNDEFKKMLDKSLNELKQAVEDLDTAAFSKNLEVDDTCGNATGDTKVDGKEVLNELEAAELQAKSTAKIISELKIAVSTLVNKEHMSDDETQKLEEMNKALMEQMEEFEEKTKQIQLLVKLNENNVPESKSVNPPAPPPPPPEELLPQVLVCGLTENNMPRIIICDSDKKKKKTKSIKSKTSMQSNSTEVAKRLSESYDMQEKLAQDNVLLEGKRFQLQEYLLSKDKACENLQRKISSLQADMRILTRENTVLNDKLAKVQGKCRPRPEMQCGADRGVCPADVENRLHYYSQTTSALEKQVEMMESDVRRMQDELVTVQRDRIELEAQRKAAVEAAQQAQLAAQARPPVHSCRSSCHGPCRPTNSMAEQQLRELREQYNRLQDDYKSKVTEVAGLRADNEKLRCTCVELEDQKQLCDYKLEEYEKEMKRYSDEKDKLVGSKELLIEQEQQLIVAKQRFREAQDELEETRALIGDQAAQLDDYRNKYLQAQQIVEEQRRQIDMMEMENNRVSEQVAVEIQRVKNQFQEKLAELSPLPDILKNTQLKLQEEQQLRILAERNAEALSRELQMARDKENSILNEMDKVRSDQILNEDERAMMQNKVEQMECKCKELAQVCEKYKQDMCRVEDVSAHREKRLEEKLHEITQLTAQLENVREESARQVARIKDRCETVRRSMQGQIAELERQLAAARAMARSAQKDRDEIRQRMQAQINNLNENFEEAQLRIRSLQGHVNFLKTSYTNMFGGDNAGDDGGCDCGNFA